MSKAQEAAERILKGQTVINDMLGHLEGKIFFANKSLSEWKRYFHIEIPPDLNTITCKELLGKLMGLYQDASFYFSWAEIRLKLTKTASEESIANAYVGLIDRFRAENKKVPAAATLDYQAKVESSEMINAQTLAEIEHNFWKKIISQLEYCRKTIENTTMNIAIEQKGMRNEL